MKKNLRYGKKSETKFQEEVMKYLNSLPKSLFHNEWGRNGNKDRPDIKGCLAGRFVNIELKEPTGILSKGQKIYLKKLEECEAVVGVATNLDEVKEVLRSYGYTNLP